MIEPAQLRGQERTVLRHASNGRVSERLMHQRGRSWYSVGSGGTFATDDVVRYLRGRDLIGPYRSTAATVSLWLKPTDAGYAALGYDDLLRDLPLGEGRPEKLSPAQFELLDDLARTGHAYRGNARSRHLCEQRGLIRWSANLNRHGSFWHVTDAGYAALGYDVEAYR